MNKGQAALEYLMTYGWALIVIAVAIGLLVIMMSSQTSGIQCVGPTGQITLQDYYITSDGASFTIMNATGSSISDVNATGSGEFGGTYDYGGTTDSISSGNTFIASGITVTGTDLTQATLTVYYRKTSGLYSTATILCSGKL